MKGWELAKRGVVRRVDLWVLERRTGKLKSILDAAWQNRIPGSAYRVHVAIT